MPKSPTARITSLSAQNKARGKGLTVRETALFAILGTLMFCSKILMECLPNIHLLGMFIVTFTVIFRQKALIPLYLYVFLDGIVSGFSVWWVPYLYIWALLWGAVMLLPRRMPDPVAAVVYPLVCGLHGFLFGTLYAPVYALLTGMNGKQMLAWIVAGLPFDLIHGISNLAAGLLILPLAELMRRLLKNGGR